MKRLALFLFAIFSVISTHAQKVDLSSDDLQNMLCKKWVSSYSLMAGARIDMPEGVPKTMFDFKKDKTFTVTTDQPGDKPKQGSWVYDRNKKLVRLTIDGKTNVTIITLASGEMSMAVDTKEATPDDPTQIIIVYKAKE